MKDRIARLRMELLELADFVQEAAYDNYGSLSTDRITEMLHLSAQLSSVAGRVDANLTGSDEPDTDEPVKVSHRFPDSKRSRSVN